VHVCSKDEGNRRKSETHAEVQKDGRIFEVIEVSFVNKFQLFQLSRLAESRKSGIFRELKGQTGKDMKK